MPFNGVVAAHRVTVNKRSVRDRLRGTTAAAAAVAAAAARDAEDSVVTGAGDDSDDDAASMTTTAASISDLHGGASSMAVSAAASGDTLLVSKNELVGGVVLRFHASIASAAVGSEQPHDVIVNFFFRNLKNK